MPRLSASNQVKRYFPFNQLHGANVAYVCMSASLSNRNWICTNQKCASYTDQYDRLPGHPAQRQSLLTTHDVVVVVEQQSTHGEVGNLDNVLVPDKAVSRRQISVNPAQRIKALPSRSYLLGHVHQSAVANMQQAINRTHWFMQPATGRPAQYVCVVYKV